MSSGIEVDLLSLDGSDQTWKSPSLVLTELIGAISRAERGLTRRSETAERTCGERLVMVMVA